MDGNRINRTAHRTARRVALGALALAGVLTGTVATAEAAPYASTAPATISDASLAPHRPGVVIVSYASGATTTERVAARTTAKARRTKTLSPRAKNTEVLTLDAGESVAAAVARLKGKRGVRFAEPDYLLTKSDVSNDPYYTNGSLWGMYGDGTSPSNEFGSAAGEAWNQGYTGSRSVAIGVIDEGIQFTHPDLAANIWTNPDEIAANGIDDDNNGYIDDIHGWDFLNNNNTIFDGNGTEGSDTHGTHVSGTIGGIGGNGAGVGGVNWAVTIVSAKFLGPSGGYTSDAARGLDYLTALKVNKGLNIVATSNSWGGGGSSATMLDAINRAGDQGILFVAAAGNSTTNNDAAGSYPSNYQCNNGGTRGWDCVIAVASTTSTGGLSSFSSYGATTVDLGAPGSGVWSTYPTDSYASLSGTSMATPHVSGAVALCASINPSLTARQLKRAVVNSVRPTASLSGKVLNGGRLDIGAMVTACKAPTAGVTGSPTTLTATSAGANRMSLTWADGATDEQFYEIERATSTNGVCGTFTLAATIGAGNTAYTVGGLTGATTYCFRVRAINDFGGGTSATSTEATGSTDAPPTPYVCAATTYSWVAATDGTPTTHTLGDDASTSVTLPFSFRYYDGTFTTAQIASNGFVRFGSGAATSFGNMPIPSAGDPENYVAPWWDDLNPAAGGSVWSMTLGSSPTRQFVVTWSDVPLFGVANSGVSTQIVLDEATGDVILQYLDTVTGASTSNGGASATIGLENLDGSAGTQVGYNQSVVSDGTALRCSTRSQNSPLVSTSSLAVGTTGVAYSQTLSASGGTVPYTWSISSGTLPDGLSLDAGTGIISGSPTTAGTSNVTVKVTDNAALVATKALSITIGTPVSITTGSLANGAVGTSYSTTLAATGGTGTYTWSVTSGTLPAGLTLTASTGRISGTPTTAGTANITVTATDGASRTNAKPLSITIITPPSVSTASLAVGTTNVAYSQTLSASGGTAPYTWSISSGTLPAGLSLNAGTGIISGSPTTAGTSNVTVKVTDNASLVATKALSLTIGTPVSVSTATLANGTVGTNYSTTLAATGGTGTYTWSVTSGTLPAGLTLTASTGRISGTPTTAGTANITVTATDGASRTNAKQLSITIIGAIPGTFSKSSPSSNATGRVRNGLVLSWAASAGAASYEYCFDTSRNSTCNGTWVSVGTATSATLNGLGSKISYEWQVRAVNSSGTRLANNGTWWKFTTAT